MPCSCGIMRVNHLLIVILVTYVDDNAYYSENFFNFFPFLFLQMVHLSILD